MGSEVVLILINIVANHSVSSQRLLLPGCIADIAPVLVLLLEFFVLNEFGHAGVLLLLADYLLVFLGNHALLELLQLLGKVLLRRLFVLGFSLHFAF